MSAEITDATGAEVLLVGGDELKVGTPLVAGARVVATVEGVATLERDDTLIESADTPRS